MRRADSQDDPRQGRAAVGNRITLNDSNSDEEQNGMLPSLHTARHGSTTTACLQQIVILCMLTVIKVKQSSCCGSLALLTVDGRVLSYCKACCRSTDKSVGSYQQSSFVPGRA